MGGRHRAQQLVDRDDKPQRCVHRVIFGRLPGIGKAVGQHALADGVRPGEQNVPGFGEPSRAEHESAHGDEGVAPPVGEPGKAGDHRASGAAIDQIAVGGQPGCGPGGPPSAFGLDRAACARDGGLRPAAAGAQHDHGVVLCEIEAKQARRGLILDTVKAARSLLAVEEVTVPFRRLHVFAIGQRDDPRQIAIRLPGNVAIDDVTGEIERVVAPMQRMIIAAGQQRPHHQPAGRVVTGATPAEDCLGAVAADQNLLCEPRREAPCRPRRRRKGRDAEISLGMNDVRRVTLSREGNDAVRPLQPGLDAVDHDNAAGRWRDRRQQQRVVATRSLAARGTRGKAAKAVGLQPLGLQIGCGGGHDAPRDPWFPEIRPLTLSDGAVARFASERCCTIACCESSTRISDLVTAMQSSPATMSGDWPSRMRTLPIRLCCDGGVTVDQRR